MPHGSGRGRGESAALACDAERRQRANCGADSPVARTAGRSQDRGRQREAGGHESQECEQSIHLTTPPSTSLPTLPAFASHCRPHLQLALGHEAANSASNLGSEKALPRLATPSRLACALGVLYQVDAMLADLHRMCVNPVHLRLTPIPTASSASSLCRCEVLRTNAPGSREPSHDLKASLAAGTGDEDVHRVGLDGCRKARCHVSTVPGRGLDKHCRASGVQILDHAAIAPAQRRCRGFLCPTG